MIKLKPCTTDALGGLASVVEVDCKADDFWENQESIYELIPKHSQVYPFFHGENDDDCHVTVILPLECAKIADEIGFCISKAVAGNEVSFAWLK
jgi:hypothetical protein